MSVIPETCHVSARSGEKADPATLQRVEILLHASPTHPFEACGILSLLLSGIAWFRLLKNELMDYKSDNVPKAFSKI